MPISSPTTFSAVQWAGERKADGEQGIGKENLFMDEGRGDEGRAKDQTKRKNKFIIIIIIIIIYYLFLSIKWETLFDLGDYEIMFTCVFQAGRILLNENDFSALQNIFLPYKT